MCCSELPSEGAQQKRLRQRTEERLLCESSPVRKDPLGTRLSSTMNMNPQAYIVYVYALRACTEFLHVSRVFLTLPSCAVHAWTLIKKKEILLAQ